MRQLALLLVLVACGGQDPVTDPDLHRLVECFLDWGETTVTACEAPCTGGVVQGEGPLACDAQIATASTFVDCREDEIFEHDGVRGCCLVQGSSGHEVIRFAVCIRDI